MTRVSFMLPAEPCQTGDTGGGGLELVITNMIRLLCHETGATAIEYGLIAALVAVAAVTIMGTVGQHLSTTFNTVATKL